jgi:hypothetical protein
VSDWQFRAPGLLIEAWGFASEEKLPFIGVTVEFDDAIPRDSRGMALEAAMRFWQRNIGSVRRGGRGDLAGWRVYVFHEGRVARIRLSYLDEDDDAERAGQPDLSRGDEESPDGQ